MAEKTTNRRRSMIVPGSLQRRILMQTTLLPLAALAGLVAVAVILGRRLINEGAQSEEDMSMMQPLLMDVVCLAAIMAGSILYVSFWFSHRVAGPAYRIVQSLKRVENGDIDFVVTLRKRDLLNEVADQLNSTLRALQLQRAGAGAGTATDVATGTPTGTPETQTPAAIATSTDHTTPPA